MVFSLLFCQRSAILEAYRRMIMKKAAAKSNTFDSDAFQMLFDGRIKDGKFKAYDELWVAFRRDFPRQEEAFRLRRGKTF